MWLLSPHTTTNWTHKPRIIWRKRNFSLPAPLHEKKAKNRELSSRGKWFFVLLAAVLRTHHWTACLPLFAISLSPSNLLLLICGLVDRYFFLLLTNDSHKCFSGLCAICHSRCPLAVVRTLERSNEKATVRAQISVRCFISLCRFVGIYISIIRG